MTPIIPNQPLTYKRHFNSADNPAEYNRRIVSLIQFCKFVFPHNACIITF